MLSPSERHKEIVRQLADAKEIRANMNALDNTHISKKNLADHKAEADAEIERLEKLAKDSEPPESTP